VGKTQRSQTTKPTTVAAGVPRPFQAPDEEERKSRGLRWFQRMAEGWLDDDFGSEVFIFLKEVFFNFFVFWMILNFMKLFFTFFFVFALLFWLRLKGF